MAREEHNPVPAPQIDYSGFPEARRRNIEAAYRTTVRNFFKQGNPNDPHVGRPYRLRVGNGYAEYMVTQGEPLVVTHLPIGVAKQAPRFHMRRLRLPQVLAQNARAEASNAKLHG